MSIDYAFNPYIEFSHFYNNDVIKKLAHRKRWTVSDNKKRPIDFVAFLTQANKPIFGAKTTDESCLVDLDTLMKTIPNISNCAYHLEADVDKVLILDIEKTCPPEVSAPLLKMAHLYGEVSMSHKGYHLVMDFPKNFYQFPEATNKVKLQHPQGWYEILIEHYVTFTRIPIPHEKFNTDSPTAVWEDVYAELATVAKESSSFVSSTITEPEVPHLDDYVRIIGKDGPQYTKTLADFHNDNSRYEYGMASYYSYRIFPVMDYYCQKGDEKLTIDQQAWILYQILLDKIPHRDKHDETRHGMPLLLDRAASAVLSANAHIAEKKKAK